MRQQPAFLLPLLAILVPLSMLAAGTAASQAIAPDTDVIDSDALPSVEPEDEEDGLDRELNEAFREYKRLYEAGYYDSAVEVAKRVVVLAIEAQGREHLQTARALTNLAIAQQKNGDFESAQQNYLAAIEIVETVDGRLSSHLVNPLRGLGNAYLEAGRPDQAIGVYERAVHVTHVNSGPQNLEQVDLLEALSESFLRLRDLKEADAIQSLSYQLYERRYGEEDPEILPAMLRRARWLHRLGLFTEERYVYLKVIDILEEEHGEGDLRLIGPLNGLARTYLYDVESAPTNRGEWALKRAVEIAETSEESTPTLVADSLIAMGDYHGLRGEAQKARRAYREAWDLLSEDEALLAERDNRFAEPAMIRRAVPPAYADEETDPIINPTFRAREFDRGRVLVDFTVNSRGRPDEIQILESVPPGLMDAEVTRSVRRFVFRPRFEEGQPVETPGQRFRHTFSYIAERLPEEIKSAMAEAEAPEAATPESDEGEPTAGEALGEPVPPDGPVEPGPAVSDDEEDTAP